MESQSSAAVVEAPPAGGDQWPAHVQMILSALETGQNAPSERRGTRRAAYRTKAHLRLFTAAKNATPALLYTRDACARGMGFITPHYLPLGYGGKVELILPTGRLALAHCTLSRCRQFSPGWYEGALSFSRDVEEFALLSKHVAANRLVGVPAGEDSET
jgi:hypothetical protein